ncbi:MAG: S-methyl-5-thioribose-1-phosphate isomerase [Spirochaetes bacterium]|nr:S-methyl-5-thioribose-1-phosphate isomerase [Spirochaetota bacterium]
MNGIQPIFAEGDSVRLSVDESAVVILDQSLLPNKSEYLNLRSAGEMFAAIEGLKVRGAPAIGICAAYCLYVLAKACRESDYAHFLSEVKRHSQYLNSSRPTAVNLSWALSLMEKVAMDNRDKPVAEIIELMGAQASAIHAGDIASCRSISEYGLSLVKNGDGVLTHCNAGALATSRYGTALGPLILGKERGLGFKVFACETRPLLQGARLTSYELHRAGIDVTLICDNMASAVMKKGWVQACFVGADRIAANGDTANKIGTSAVAILAKYYGIPFYVLAPTSTIDFQCAGGDDIVIELRDPAEIKEKFFAEPVALKEIPCYNPAFDVTDAALISGIVTEKGLCRPPYKESLGRLFGGA